MLPLLNTLARLPLPVLHTLALALAPLVRHVWRYRRRLVRSNLAAAFPERDRRQLRALERDFYRHLCTLAVETLWGTRASAAELRRRVRLENTEVIDALAQRRQPMLLLGLHQGNWEWLASALSDYLPCPVDLIYKPLHQGGIDRLLRRARSRFGGNPITFGEAARELLRRRGQFRAFSLWADQAPFKKDRRHWASFLNRPAPFYLGPQKFAEVTRYPVVFITMHRLRRGHYSARFELLAEPPYGRGGTAVIEAYVAACEKAVRAQPETWLWSHDKWKAPAPTARP